MRPLLLGCVLLTAAAHEFTFAARRITNAADNAFFVFAIDVDGDGDVDVLSASRSDDTVAWYENDGSESFAKRDVTAAADDAVCVFAIDIDGDGDVDVLSASRSDDTVAWHENDGSESFTERVVTAAQDGPWVAHVVDVDGDGAVDVLAASDGDDTVAWHQNDGSESFTERVVDDGADGARFVYGVDVDGDGLVDVVAVHKSAGAIAWYEQQTSASSVRPTFAEHVVTANLDTPLDVSAADLNGDGVRDLVVSAYGDDLVAWYDVDAGLSYSVAASVSNPRGVFAVDVDGDGDLDVLAALDGANTVACVYALDVDGDGDAGALSASMDDDAVAWYEQVYEPSAAPTPIPSAAPSSRPSSAPSSPPSSRPSSAPSSPPTAVPTAPPTSYALEGSLVAHFSFESESSSGDAYYDDAGSGLVLATDATATTRYGGAALAFDGADDCALGSDAIADAVAGGEARTVCLWAAVDDWNGGYLFSYGSDVDLGFFGLRAADAGEVDVVFSGQTAEVALAGSDDGGWHHYCLAYKATSGVCMLYYDGEFAAETSVALDTGGAYEFSVGAAANCGQDFLAGAVDEVYIYATELSAARIEALYDDGLTAAPTAVFFQETLVAYYSFDDGTAANDGGDGDLDGTITGATATTGRDGSGALSFDGTDDYVAFPSAATAKIQGSNPRTVCLWAVIDDFSGDGGLFDYGSYEDSENFALRVDNTDGSLRVQLWGVDADVALSGSDDGGWHHYCLTYDGSDWVLYFDGSQAATGPQALDTGDDAALCVGRWGGDYYLPGTIDEVYVYASALDAARIQVLHAGYAVTPPPTRAPTRAPTLTPLPTHVSAATLVARYAFDDGTAAEESDADLDGAIFGATATKGLDGGGALAFDGAMGYVEFPAAAVADVVGSASRTLCAWAAIDAFGGGGIFAYGASQALAEFGLRTNEDAAAAAGSLVVQLYETDVSSVTLAGADDGGWHHYCLSYEGTSQVCGGASTHGRDGAPDGARLFDGVDDYVELPAAATADVLGAAPRTLCLWARTDTFVQKAGLFNYGANSDRNEFGLRARTEEGVIRVQFFGGDYDYDETLGADFSLGAWHHYCLTYDGTSWVFYFDGAGRHSESVAADTTDDPLWVGRQGSKYFSGAIDEFYIYGTALDADEVAVLFLDGMPSPAPSTGAPSSAPSLRPTLAPCDDNDACQDLQFCNSDASASHAGWCEDCYYPGDFFAGTDVCGRFMAACCAGDASSSPCDFCNDEGTPAPTPLPFLFKLIFESSDLFTAYVTWAFYSQDDDVENARLFAQCDGDGDGRCDETYPDVFYTCMLPRCFTYALESSNANATTGLSQRLVHAAGEQKVVLGKSGKKYYDFCISQDGAVYQAPSSVLWP
ncbi:glutathione transferase [Aureococcus anophagefferens]|nr:glutathione transferase [Aureococcus anophagefferens]